LNRRALLRGVLGVPGVGAAFAIAAEATEYSSPLLVFAEVDRLSGEVGLRLRALSEASPGAKAFASSVLADHERERGERARLRGRLGLPPSIASRPDAPGLLSLDALRTAQEALVHAHAEGLPALGDPFAVQVMAGHLVDLSRHLAVIDLWIESEANRG
jgi:hypothetical protein